MRRIAETESYFLSYLLTLLVACGGSNDADQRPDGSSKRPDAPDTPFVPATHFADAENRKIPASGLPDGFGRAFSFTSYRYWDTFDVDGDGFLDIVHTGDTAFTARVWDAAGNPYWKVYAGDATGWSTAAHNYAVPKPALASGFYAVGVTSTPSWRVGDMNGDGRPDLVFPADPATNIVWDAAGAPHWKVFLGAASGFDATATAWAVPPSGTTAGFSTVVMSSGALQWVLLDITGDGKRDLIQTADPATGRVWDSASAPHWKVYANTGAGFATQATLWSVPPNGFAEGFSIVSSASGVRQWTLIDLDHDGHRDLVQTADTATGTVWDASGSPYWKLFRGTASGFTASSMTWRVPPSGLTDGFATAESNAAYRHWTLVDIDGDADLDLVQPGDTSFAQRTWDSTGAPYWKVFANTGDGFSLTLHRWNVPKGPTDGFYATEVSVGALDWFVADVDVDGYVDLVHTMNPTTSAAWDATGSAYWKVFRGQP